MSTVKAKRYISVVLIYMVCCADGALLNEYGEGKTVMFPSLEEGKIDI
jgi:hypothetical protein